MKKAILLCFVFATTVCFAQRDNSIIREANLIIIKPATQDHDILYKEIASFLLDRGFRLSKTDKELGLITTEYRQGDWGATRLQFMIRDTLVHLTGETYEPGLSNGPIDNRGARGSYARRKWNEFNQLALQFPRSGPLLYLKK